MRQRSPYDACERSEKQPAHTFSSAPGITYDLERSINGIDWLTLTATIIGGPDATSIITDTNTPADANLVLYRIIQR